MGQSVLRDRRSPFRIEALLFLSDQTWMCALVGSKGNRVNIPEPGHGERSFGAMCGNANEVGDVGQDPGKSSLFFVRDSLPGIGLPGDRDTGFP